jgi:hypothetical protein
MLLQLLVAILERYQPWNLPDVHFHALNAQVNAS